ncbi:hypothetical protein Tco_1534798 [Tanacetum coccineum]
MSRREFILVMGLHTTEEMESARFGTYWAESARLIACNITRRSQAPEKVTVTDWFNLRGMDVDSGQLVVRLAEHFGLQGLTVIVQDLLVIDMAELVRLQICDELDDTWAWVAPRPERQPDATAGALEVAKGAPVVDEGA